MSIFAELKRRNVFRVALAYLVVAWLVIQVAATLAPALRLPDWINTAIVFVLILGFPIALLFAWIFELTPQGLVRDTSSDGTPPGTNLTGRLLDWVIIAVLCAALGYFAFDEAANNRSHDTAPPTQPLTPAESRQSIAVLPFVNTSDDQANEYFSDGLSEEILYLLARIPNLKVIGRTSSFAFKGKAEDLRTIGATLGVKNLLDGSVRKSGDRVRITVQLINAVDGASIWSQSYDRSLSDIFEIQDDVARAIVQALQLHVGTVPTRGRPTENPDAYALFLKGRSLINVTESRAAQEALIEATKLDPGFAEAYELLAYCYWLRASWEITTAAAQRLTFEAAAKALALDSNRLFARGLQQSAQAGLGTWPREIKAFERLVQEQPGNVDALFILAQDLLIAGYANEAADLTERLVDLDPLSPLVHYLRSCTLSAVQRSDESIAELHLIDGLSRGAADWYLGERALQQRRDDDAVQYFESDLRRRGYADTSWVADLVRGARGGNSGQRHLDRRIPEIVASLPEEMRYELQRRLVQWYLLFGYLDRYFALIQEIEITATNWSDADQLIFFGMVFGHLGFTAHPEYLEVVAAIGIRGLWDERGPPDSCKKMDGRWQCR